MTQKLLWILFGVEKVYNWVFHFKHLQFIKFNIDKTLDKLNLIQFFQKNIRF